MNKQIFQNVIAHEGWMILGVIDHKNTPHQYKLSENLEDFREFLLQTWVSALTTETACSPPLALNSIFLLCWNELYDWNLMPFTWTIASGASSYESYENYMKLYELHNCISQFIKARSYLSLPEGKITKKKGMGVCENLWMQKHIAVQVNQKIYDR